MKLITFTVPCYNSAEYMRKCVDSLLIAGEQCEIIIVNDGSTDDTGKIADSYAAKYPNIVRVLHQENGGHGEGINQGILHAQGKYFKVVDSDDWLEPKALRAVIDTLSELEKQGGVDLFLCNYRYYQKDKGVVRTIRYRSVLPVNKIFGWDNIGRFMIAQYITLHSAIFNTQILRESKTRLPKHTFYVDNLLVYYPLPNCRRLYYMPANLYMYLVGREGQTVATESLMRNCGDQVDVSTLIFKLYDFDYLKSISPRLYSYMYHESLFMLTIASVFPRLNKSEETEQMVKNMWDEVIAHNEKYGTKMRKKSYAWIVNIDGKFGQDVVKFLYWLSHLVVDYN